MQLPPSFRHVQVDNDTFRANLHNFDDINTWIEEYRALTCTTWNTKISKAKCTRKNCRKEFICQHSSLRKIDASKRKPGVSKNFGCQAAIDISIKIITENTLKTDKYIRDGLPAKIVFKNSHDHPSEAKSRQKPLKEVRDQFMEYFNQGLGITESMKVYESKLLSEHLIADDIDVSNSLIFPRPRCVRSWHSTWKKTNNIPSAKKPRRATKSVTEQKPTLGYLVFKESDINFEISNEESDEIINNVAFEQNIDAENSNSEIEIFEHHIDDNNLTTSVVTFNQHIENDNSDNSVEKFEEHVVNENLDTSVVQFEQHIGNENSETSVIMFEQNVDADNSNTVIVTEENFFASQIYDVTDCVQNNIQIPMDHQYENCFKDDSPSSVRANNALLELIGKKLNYYGLPSRQIQNIHEAVKKIKSSKDFYNLFSISKKKGSKRKTPITYIKVLSNSDAVVGM